MVLTDESELPGGTYEVSRIALFLFFFQLSLQKKGAFVRRTNACQHLNPGNLCNAGYTDPHTQTPLTTTQTLLGYTQYTFITNLQFL